MQKVIVLGAGSWGTALAACLAQRGLVVQFWGRDATLMQGIHESRINSRYLPQLKLPESVCCTHELSQLEPADALFFVVPSKAMRSTAQAVKEAGVKARSLVSCTKGIELDSGKCMSQVLHDVFPEQALAVLSGPNHAEEVALQQPTAAVVAAADGDLAQSLQSMFTAPWFRCYTSSDVMGVEWAGAMKNPYAIAAGIARGLNLGDNAIAALVTRALAEMVRLGALAGGRVDTFYGLSGVGDLVATCYSQHSRNNRLGMALGQGKTLAEHQAGSSMVAEGVPNTLSLYHVARKLQARTPLLDVVHAVLYEDMSPKRALVELLSREPRAEVD